MADRDGREALRGEGDALHEAVGAGNIDAVNDLLEGGASVASKGADGIWTPLHYAAREGRGELVKLLLLKGADKDDLDKHGRTPLYLAVVEGQLAAALALLAAGADVSPQCGQFKRSVVQEAAQWGHGEVLRAVIERGADLEAADEPNKCTALHCAAIQDAIESIDMLVEAGANIGAPGHENCTPLHQAATHRHPKALSALLNYGADVNAQDNHQQTPLYYAAREAGIQGAEEVVDSLLRSGADETILNDEGKAAADVVGVIGTFLQANYHYMPENVNLVRKLLANAPADRAWRRRGYLVLCRAHPDRMQQIQESSSAPAGVARSAGKLAGAEASGCTGTADERPSSDWAVVVAKVLELQEEGVFRMIVGYL